MIPDPPQITMTSFAGFVVADSTGQLSKVRDVKRRYEQEYTRGGDYWKRWIEDLQGLLRRREAKDQLPLVGRAAPNVRHDQYSSASEGFGHFWGRKIIELRPCPLPVTWQHGRLKVRVNPEWWLNINGTRTLVKLHTTRDIVLDQRMANPLIHLLAESFPGDHDILILDVHRGKAWRQTSRRDFGPVLRMQAAAFLAGWDVLFGQGEQAA